MRLHKMQPRFLNGWACGKNLYGSTKPNCISYTKYTKTAEGFDSPKGL